MSTRRCEHLVRRGTGEGTCDLPLDQNGYCDRPRNHIDQVTFSPIYTNYIRSLREAVETGVFHEEGVLRTPDAWCKILGVVILDPDGWDRENFEEDWARPIGLDEFIRKTRMSTISGRV